MMNLAEGISVTPLRHWVGGVLAVVFLAGCTSVPPQHVGTDRMDYG